MCLRFRVQSTNLALGFQVLGSADDLQIGCHMWEETSSSLGGERHENEG